MGEDKKKIRVVGINRGKNLPAYAKKVEKAMNDLLADGYRVEPHEEPNGVLLMCTLKSTEPEQEHPLARLLGGNPLVLMAQRPTETSSTGWSPRTEELIKRFADEVTPETNFVLELQKPSVLRKCTAGFSVPELETAKNEVSKAIEDHKPHCNGDCPRSRFWSAVVTAVTQVAQQNLQ